MFKLDQTGAEFYGVDCSDVIWCHTKSELEMLRPKPIHTLSHQALIWASVDYCGGDSNADNCVLI